MKRNLALLLPAGLALTVIIVVGGCCINFGWWNQQQHERTEQVSAPIDQARQISVDTSFGDITIIGADTNDCNVIAKITGQAPSTEEAKSLAEQTKIKLEPDGNTLIIRAEKPHLSRKRSVSITYDIVVPTRTSVKCKSSYGKIKLANIRGVVSANTSFGNIEAENITGRMDLDTSYGKVDCQKISCAEFLANSSFGDIEVDFTNACPNNLISRITTSYGNVEADVPTDFTGDVVIETSFGKVRTELPIMIKGDVSKTRLTGTIGQGNGKLNFKTSFGSVNIE